MAQTIPAGKIQTVLGLVDAKDFGKTMAHEHLFHDMEIFFREPQNASERLLAHQPVTLKNLAWVKRNDSSNLDNLRMLEEDLLTEEVRLYKMNGGDSIVELTSAGIFGRDPEGLARLSRMTGVNIVMAVGFNRSGENGPGFNERTEDSLVEEMVHDITVGVGVEHIKAGIIGEIEIGRLDEVEERTLRASARAQQITHAGISIHPAPTDEGVLKLCKILLDAGANPAHTVIGHQDVISFTDETVHKILDMGFLVGYDNFGFEARMELPGLGFAAEMSDFKRMDAVTKLCAEGYSDRIVLSHDLCTKIRCESYGGNGLAHVIRDICPVLIKKGVTPEQINDMLVVAPRKLLCWDE